jgi:Phage capsid protein
MAISISNAFVTLFDAEVKQAYQADAVLRNTVRLRTGVTASTHKFPKIGAGVASVRIPQTDVSPLNVSYSQATVTLSDWIAAEYSDIFNQAKVNFDERAELVQVVGKAIGRRADQLVIDAIAASGTTLSVTNDIGGTDSNLNVAKLRKAKALLDTTNVPMGDRYLLIHAENLQALLTETAVTSTDFNTVKALVQGEVDTFLGFKFVTIGDRTEGGLVGGGSGQDRKCWAWHKSAVGMAEGMGIRSEINYIPEKTSWLVASMLSAGATTIDAGGIVEIICRE